MKISKAVIPVAGYGTRFLPFTKTVPKQMLPIVAKPVIQYIVEELVASGLSQVVLITGSGHKAVEDYFDDNYELEAALERSGKTSLLHEIRRITDMAQMIYVRQKEPLGNGHALLSARPVVGEEPFVMFWGDDILLGRPPVARQLMDVAERFDAPVVSVRRVPPDDFEKYGMVAVEPIAGEDRISRAVRVVEKPPRDQSPSDLAQIGGFVLTPDIFQLLDSTPIGPSGELYLADALDRLMRDRVVYAYEFEGTRYDAGNKLDYLRATVELALQDPEVGPPFRAYLETLDITAARSLVSPH